MIDLNIYTLKHSRISGTAFWLYFEYTCNNIDPADLEQLHAILIAEDMHNEAAQITVKATA